MSDIHTGSHEGIYDLTSAPDKEKPSHAQRQDAEDTITCPRSHTPNGQIKAYDFVKARSGNSARTCADKCGDTQTLAKFGRSK
jgi:hypothetical protein